MNLGRNDFDVIPSGEPTPPSPTIYSSLLTLHNSIRSSPLTMNDKLMVAAQQHSDWMASLDILSHEENTQNFHSFLDRARNAGYNMMWGGENVAEGVSDPEGVFNQWLSSPPHHSNMINTRFKDSGFSRSLDKNGIAYWCAVFGSLTI
jgi:uncharacterized protein YkwD